MVCFTILKKKIKNAKRREKTQPVAVPLDMLPERRTMTIHPEISARGSLIPAGDGSKLLSDACPPGTGPLDHMRQIPFLTAAQFHLTTLTKISTDMYPYPPSIWYILRFEHARMLKNDTMTEGTIQSPVQSLKVVI